jgi:hypothetical protein
VHARVLGYAVVDIVANPGVREATVSRWCSRHDQVGWEALPGDRTGTINAALFIVFLTRLIAGAVKKVLPLQASRRQPATPVAPGVARDRLEPGAEAA